MNSDTSQQVPPGFENELNNIAIDFDGVIHNFNKGWHDGTCYGKPIPGALEAIRNLSQNYKIIILLMILSGQKFMIVKQRLFIIRQVQLELLKE